MLKLKHSVRLPRLLDRTLMAQAAEHASPKALRRLYAALIKTGVAVQLPARLSPALGKCLVPERTLLSAGDRGAAQHGILGILGDSRCLWEARVAKACAPEAKRLPDADILFLSADAGLFLEDGEASFARFLRRVKTPAVLDASGDTQLATALAIGWLSLGGACAAAALPGAGPSAALESLMMTLALQGDASLNLRALPAAAEAWEAMSGIPIPPYQPVIGRRIFDVSSGVHVDGLLKDSGSYEPFPPEAVGRERRIVLDQHSGRSAVKARLRALDINPDTVDVELITRQVRALGRDCGEVDEAAFAVLIRAARLGACV